METGVYVAPSHWSFVNLESINHYSSGNTVTMDLARHWDKEGLQWLRDKLEEILTEMDKPRVPTHAVFNSDNPPSYLESGRLYPIHNYNGTAFYITIPYVGERLFFVDQCTHIYPAQWTLVHLD